METSKAVNIADTAVVLNLFFGGPGNSRKVDSDQVKVDADPDAIHVSKELLDSKEYRAVWHHVGTVKSYLGTRCLPSFFRRGFYLLPVELVSEVDTKLTEFRAEWDGLVKKFIRKYPNAIEAAKARLNKLYDPADYPSVDVVQRAFRFEVRYLAFSTPGKLQSISKALFKREQQKAERYWAEAAVEIQTALRTSMSELVIRMVDRLGGSSNGKKKVFRDSTVTKMEEFLDLFQKRNIVNDAETEVLVGKAKGLLKGVDANILRTDEEARMQVRQGFEKIKESLDTMLMDRPKRKLALQ